MKKGLLLSVLMFLVGVQIAVNAHGNTNHLDSGNTKLIICVANNDATAPIDTIFTEDDIRWFNDSTREIRFKDPLQQVREKLWSKSKNLEFRLGENVLFKATRTSNVMSSTVHDLVLCYGSEVKASIKGFFLYDCYPLKLLNDEQVQANIQKRAPQWEIFLDYLKSKNMIDNHGIVNINGLDYELDEIAHTAQLTSGKTGYQRNNWRQ